MISWLVAGTDDPLGPVDQDVNEIRETACRPVRPESVCSPPAPRPADPTGGGGGGGGLSAIFELLVWLLFFSMIAALVYAIVRAVMAATGSPRRVRRRTGGDDEQNSEEVEELAPVAIDRSREPADWRREAEEHRRAGRFRDAVRCSYRAFVGDLARRGLIDEIPGRTTGEERAQMAVVAPAEAPTFAAVAELFDQAWFGDAEVADSDVREMEELERRVLSTVGGSRP
jgi:hypothetical protein